MHSLFDDPGRYLADASSNSGKEYAESLASEQELITVEDLERLFEDDPLAAPSYPQELLEDDTDPAVLEEDEVFQADLAIADDFEIASVSGGRTLQEPSPIKTLNLLSGIDPPHFIYARSSYGGPPPMQITSERQALAGLSEQALQSQQLDEENKKSFDEYELNNFSIYVPGSIKMYAYELTGLNNLGRNLMNTLVFDGLCDIPRGPV